MHLSIWNVFVVFCLHFGSSSFGFYWLMTRIFPPFRRLLFTGTNELHVVWSQKVKIQFSSANGVFFLYRLALASILIALLRWIDLKYNVKSLSRLHSLQCNDSLMYNCTFSETKQKELLSYNLQYVPSTKEWTSLNWW